MVGFGAVIFSLGWACLAEAAMPERQNSFLGVDYDPTKKTDSTANPAMCTSIYVMLVGGLFISFAGQVLQNEKIHGFGQFWNLVGAILATFYAAHHGLGKAWWEGGHNLTDHCAGVAAAALVMYVFFAIGLCCCGGFAASAGAAILQEKMTNMRAATLKRSDTIGRKEKIYLESKEFLDMCNKTFKEADKDGNGRLDLNELKDVVLFDLTPEQQKRVQNEALFIEAFEECDKDHDHSIDPEEFVDVMKFVRAHAVDTDL